jgi:hypothetical protein
MSDMGRREFITLLGGVSLAWPLAGRAQSSGKVHRIGVLRVGEPPPSYIQPFREALSRLGYVDGQNIIIEYGVAQSVEQLPDVAAELIGRKVDVVLASGTPSVVPARNRHEHDPGGIRGRHRSQGDGRGHEPRAAGGKRHWY